MSRRAWPLFGFALLLAVGTPASAADDASSAARRVVEYARDLEGADRDRKREAAYQLSRMEGPEVVAALPQLIKALDDEQQQVWFGAITAIERLGPAAEPAIPALLKELTQWEPYRRDRQGGQSLYRTAVALGAIGPAAIPGVSNALRHERWQARAGAAMALGFAGTNGLPVLPALVTLLDDSRREVHDAASEALTALAPHSVPLLASRLAGPGESASRIEAARVLGRIGLRAEGASENLAQLARRDDEDAAVRAAALSAWFRVEGAREKVVPVLWEAWRTGPDLVRAAAEEALLLLRPAERWVIPEILKDLRSEDTARRMRTAGLIVLLGPSAAAVVPPMIAELSAKPGGAGIDQEWIRALAAIGPATMEAIVAVLEREGWAALEPGTWSLQVLQGANSLAVPVLLEALAHAQPVVRAGALTGIASVGDGGRRTLRAVLPLLEDAEPRVRARAWTAAVKCRAGADQLLPRLGPALELRDPEVSRAAMLAVAELGAGARDAVPSLIRESQSTDGTLRLAAVRALGALGADASAAVPGLVGAMAGASAAEQVAMLDALGRIGGEGVAGALPGLAALAVSGDVAVRRSWVEMTGRLGGSARVAVPVLTNAWLDRDVTVRAASLVALSKVDPESEGTIQRLVEALGSDEASLRLAAGSALMVLGERGRPAEARLFAALDVDTDRAMALEALRAIHPTSVERLEAALRHRDWNVRVFAADGLARLGKDAAAAVPALERAVREDAHEDVKRASRRALRRIREG